MQMAEMQQQMMQQGSHQMPLGMTPADLQEGEDGDEDLDGEPEVDQLELEGQDEVEGVEPASPEVAES
ncbi:hypothetical protein BC830DRAFT_1174272 [Chytriomyces sp. MP71]|nr:hypothetical protein BC830DRAFT_1174272 [Chytriomyces sp. MP71]